MTQTLPIAFMAFFAEEVPTTRIFRLGYRRELLFAFDRRSHSFSKSNINHLRLAKASAVRRTWLARFLSFRETHRYPH